MQSGRIMPSARIKVGNREVTLGAFDESLVAVAQEAARQKKIELSAGARGMACTDEVIQALRAAAEEAVRAAEELAVDQLPTNEDAPIAH